METLVLTSSFQPHRVVSWQRAISMCFDGKVEVLSEYAEDICSVNLVVKMPAVVRLVRTVRYYKRGLKFSRANVLSRDGFTCQYCGAKPELRQLTFDHVVPRSQGGATTWENIATACAECNSKKGGRTPEQAGIKLRRTPERPRDLASFGVDLSGSGVPESWRDWVWWSTDSASSQPN